MARICFAFVASIAAAVISQNAGAQTLSDFTIHHEYESVRALGMGDAFVGLADDYQALYYNPAGLARTVEPEINLGLQVGADSKVYPLYQSIQSDTSSQDSNSAVDMVNLLEGDYGNHYSVRLPLLQAFWVRPRWGLSIIPINTNIDMEIHNIVGPALGLIAIQDTVIAYGRGWDVHWRGNDRISMGITGKLIYRGYYNQLIPASSLALSSEILRPQDADEGLTADADFGMLWTPKLGPRNWMRFTRPTFGFTVHNVGSYGYITNLHLINASDGTPPSLVRSLDVGSVWELPDFWIFKTRFLADERDIGDPNFTFQKGSHLGAEFLWKIRSWWQGGWRVGLNQGYFCAGFSGVFGIFSLDLATYGEEEGTSDVPLANRIYMLKASLDW